MSLAREMLTAALWGLDLSRSVDAIAEDLEHDVSAFVDQRVADELRSAAAADPGNYGQRLRRLLHQRADELVSPSAGFE